MTATRIPVTGPQPYEVVIGTGVRAELPSLLSSVDRVGLIHPPTLRALADEVQAELAGAGFAVCRIEIADGEDAKTLAVAGMCFDRLAEAGFTRSDALIGLGGGATTDLAGWVAASWLRGVRVVQLPTTLAGMVDAAIGGKTGINIERGKNLVGAFHPPIGVLCDLSTLSTLPAADYVAGLAEVVKCGFIADPTILDLLEIEPGLVVQPGNPYERELIERSVSVKATVVSQDLTEQGLREILNYGHTLAHAIEKAEHYRWRHGAAVSIGLVFVAEVARLLGRLDEDSVDRHRRVLSSLGLPVTYQGSDWTTLLDTMRLDKKARGNRLRLVLLEGLAKPTTVDIEDLSVLQAAFSVVTA